MRRIAPLPLLALILLAACGKPQVLTVEPAPPRSPQSVRLLLEPPVEPHHTVALIRSTAIGFLNDMEKAKREVREAAARVGADAVILGMSSARSSGSQGVAGPDGHVTFVVSDSDELRIYARAIVFTR